MEVLGKPAAGSVLQAMAEAYPDRVDLGLLAVVLGCERPVVDGAVDELVSAGYARSEAPDGDAAHGHGPCLTEAGMAMACGRAEPGETSTDILRRLEACTLGCLAAVRSARQHSSRCEQQA